VKTRLVPLLGARGAADLHARLVERTLQTAVASGLARIDLYCAPGTGNPFFGRMKKRFGIRLRVQGRGDLGDRMYRALRRNPRAILIGSDCPALRPADLRAAARALHGGADAVLSPAEDGGYALIGVRRASRELFAGIEWGSARVLSQTRRRLRRLRWQWTELRTVWDVDRPGDVARLRRSKLLGNPALRSPRISSAGRRRVRP
jgi:rSAM/selenodomain-associated transferase 1